jgi:hypothetical protein
VPGPFAALGKLLQDGFVVDGDKVPGLDVLGGLGPLPSVQDRLY